MAKVTKKKDGTLFCDIRWRNALITVALLQDKADHVITKDNDDDEYFLSETAAAGAFVVDRLEYLLVFRKGFSTPVVIHECWHLFFYRMDDIDHHRDICFDEVGNEVYAYDFEDLYETVSETLSNMKKGEKNLKK